jgi:exodeoxyribonuclease VII large subunit
MDLFDDDTPPATEGRNEPEYTVSEISGAVKKTLEGKFGRIRVRGEVGRVVRAASGHMYYDLKDDRGVLACNTWKGQVSGLGMIPEEGMEVIVTGKMSAFAGQSKYNINVDSMEIAGEGALMAMLEKRKKALAAEGLFDPARKVALPYLPEIIGVVTSPTGAVIRDILHRLRDRFPRKVLIWPVPVQGAACAPAVARAIEGFNALTPGGALPRPDLLIVARGGGSIEDLWGFNEEIVARAAAASDIPLISAVGHETDTTLIDFVADHRAPTPTAAAELAVPVRLDLLAWVDGQDARMTQSMSNAIATRQQRLRDLGRALPRVDSLMDGPRQRLDTMADRLPAALIRGVQNRRIALTEATGSIKVVNLRRRVEDDTRRMQDRAARLGPALGRSVVQDRKAFEARAALLKPRVLQADVSQKRSDFNRLTQRLSETGVRQIERLRSQIDSTDRLRETLSYKATLERGYAVVRGDGAVVTTQEAAGKARALEIEFADGRLSLDRPSDPQGKLL